MCSYYISSPDIVPTCMPTKLMHFDNQCWSTVLTLTVVCVIRVLYTFDFDARWKWWTALCMIAVSIDKHSYRTLIVWISEKWPLQYRILTKMKYPSTSNVTYASSDADYRIDDRVFINCRLINIVLICMWSQSVDWLQQSRGFQI